MKDEKKAPKLRFKGFTDDWEQCKLSDISEKSYEKNTDNKYSTVLTNSAEYGIVKQRDFFDKDIANSSNISGYYVVRKNYFVYNPRISNQAKFGPINRNKLNESGIMSPLYLVFTVHDIDESFLETLFQTTTWHRFMYQNGDTGARADRFAIKDSTFMSMPIKVPSLEEQHKLALAFQKLDQTITLHEEKKRQLERLKSALLQKMFADKSGYPAVRFKGFDDIWDQEKLNSLVRLHRGLTYSPNNVQDSGIRVLRSSNILDGQFVMTDDDIFVKSSVVNIPTVKDGDILITAANGSIKLVGKHAIISGISENTAVSGGFMLVGSSRIPDFVNSLFDTSWYQRFIRKYVTGGNGSIGNLKKNDLDKQYVKVPTTSEQERIGEFFREIDQLIINNQIKHEKLLELKKFLLQNMFI